MNVALQDALAVPASDHLAAMLWDTDPELFALAFRSDRKAWRHVFEAEWTAEAGLHTRRRASLAIGDGQELGIVICFPGADAAANFTASVERESSNLPPDRAQHLRHAFELMGWLFPPVPDSVLYVMNLVVAQEARGLGVGRMLMRKAEETARQLRLDGVHLDAVTHAPAFEFYRRIGYQPLVETRLCQLPEGYPLGSHSRMVKQW
jgi:ribosomal protein S18 acetylase RimI-like enzyme